MKTISRRAAEARRGERKRASLRLCVFAGVAIATAAGGADLARVDALLVQAQALVTAARTELATTNPTNGTNDAPVTGRIDLTTFAWAGGKTAEPAGLPGGARYGEGVASGKRTCQWHFGTWILHAVMTSGTKTATGRTVAWYHFTRSPEPYSGLSSYKWTNTHRDSDAGGVWYRWAGAK